MCHFKIWYRDYSKEDYSNEEDDKKLKELISLNKAEVNVGDKAVDVGEKRKIFTILKCN
jgi:hypothetical protein